MTRAVQITSGRVLILITAFVFALAVTSLVNSRSARATHLTGSPAIYTLDADFDEGTLVNVNHDAPNNDQLQLDSMATPFAFIWIAASTRGTVVKIDTNTGLILGEFRSTPSSQGGGNPSRTTVDNDGSVWVANRNNVSGGFGTIIHIGLDENNQCEDRNGNGVIDTSSGLSDIKAWADATGTRGVATAADECIVHYTQVNSQGSRHLSVDANNDVWVGGLTLPNFDLIRGGRYDMPLSGTITRSETSVGFGGYGGLIDGNGVIWSARPLLRWDVANPLIGPNGDPAGSSIGPPAAGTNWSGQPSPDSYGLCIDPGGNVWNTQLSGNLIHKYAPDGLHLGSFPHGNEFAQGCVADANGDIWVAHSLLAGGQTTVGHLLNDGTFVDNVPLAGGVGPTGVAVDAAGRIWATNIASSTVSRIDPNAGPIGGGGVPTGAVDLTVNLGAGAGPYNYSDMTGSSLIAPPNTGAWTIVNDCDEVDAEWGTVSWNSSEPGDSSITVAAASGAAAGGPFSASENAVNGGDLSVPNGQFLKVVAIFTRSTTTDADGDGIGDTPILFDLTFDCTQNGDGADIDLTKSAELLPGADDDDDNNGDDGDNGDVGEECFDDDDEGCLVKYTLTVTNNGAGDAESVEVNDGLPDGLAFDSAEANAGIYDSETGVWTVGALANGESATLMIFATTASENEDDEDGDSDEDGDNGEDGDSGDNGDNSDDDGEDNGDNGDKNECRTIVNSADASSELADPDPTNNSASATVLIGEECPDEGDDGGDDEGDDGGEDEGMGIFAADIQWLVEQGITKGCNPPVNDRFCPDDPVTRGQMAAFLVRALGLTDQLADPFTDDDDSIFEADIEKLAAAGISNGCNPPSNDRYCPDSPLTRGQMAALLVRALGYTDNGGGDLFTDDDDSIFADDIDKLGTADVTKGCNPPLNDRYCPDKVVTRGQMAAFLHRALG